MIKTGRWWEITFISYTLDIKGNLETIIKLQHSFYYWKEWLNIYYTRKLKVIQFEYFFL